MAGGVARSGCWTLPELKVSGMNAAVVQRKYKLTACSYPRTFSLPDVVVHAAAEVETAASSVKRFSYVHTWIASVAIE